MLLDLDCSEKSDVCSSQDIVASSQPIGELKSIQPVVVPCFYALSPVPTVSESFPFMPTFWSYNSRSVSYVQLIIDRPVPLTADVTNTSKPVITSSCSSNLPNITSEMMIYYLLYWNALTNQLAQFFLSVSIFSHMLWKKSL